MITIDLTNLPKVTNPVYYNLYNDQHRYLILYGGAGSGKSVFAAQKLVYRILTERPHKFLVVRKVARTIRGSCFAEIRNIISSWGMSELFNINKSDMEITCINGNQIVFAGLDDAEKLKSIHGITGIWIEEASEITQEDFQQLDLRLRGKTEYYKQIIFTFNPVSITHWLKQVFFDEKKENTRILKTTYKDNKFIDEEYSRVLEELKDSDPYYYTVYALGEWGVVGQTVFDAQKVTNRIYQLRGRKPIKKGFFIFEYVNDGIIDSSIQWVDDPNGYITIYEDVQKGHPYVVGGDTAGEGSDYFAGQVLDNVTGKQVATLHHQFDEDLYTRQMYCLGKYYNNALIGIETNFSTFPVKELARLGYDRQYIREQPDTYTGKLQKRYGFKTTGITRPLIIANLVKIVRDHTELLNDIPTLEEMLTFVRNEQGKPEAQEGSHDDLIMALAIAYHIREQQDMRIAPKEIEIPDYLPEDVKEDLLNDPQALELWQRQQRGEII